MIPHRRAWAASHAVALVARRPARIEAASLAGLEGATQPRVGRLRVRRHVDVCPASRARAACGQVDLDPVVVIEESPAMAETRGSSVPAEGHVRVVHREAAEVAPVDRVPARRATLACGQPDRPECVRDEGCPRRAGAVAVGHKLKRRDDGGRRGRGPLDVVRARRRFRLARRGGPVVLRPLREHVRCHQPGDDLLDRGRVRHELEELGEEEWAPILPGLVVPRVRQDVRELCVHWNARGPRRSAVGHQSEGDRVVEHRGAVDRDGAGQVVQIEFGHMVQQPRLAGAKGKLGRAAPVNS